MIRFQVFVVIFKIILTRCRHLHVLILSLSRTKFEEVGLSVGVKINKSSL